jgi:hypothetical protein
VSRAVPLSVARRHQTSGHDRHEPAEPGTALAAAILSDPANAPAKASARATALSYFESATGSADLFAFAHSAGPAADPYASRERNKRLIDPWWTYVLPRRGPAGVPMAVPPGAEVLLETR